MDSVSSFFQWENSLDDKPKCDSKNGRLSSSYSNNSTRSDTSKGDERDKLELAYATTSSSTSLQPKARDSVKEGKQEKQSYMSQQLTDRLIEKLFTMALPPTNDTALDTIEGRFQYGKSRPQLSVQTMSKNFIQLNSRLSYPFQMIDDIIKFLNWENPKFTLTILTIYTNIVLKPLPLLASLPIFFILFSVMVPAYQFAHPPETCSILGKYNPILADGPQLSKVERPKPAPELSKEFLLNLTDLQNHMLLYVAAWDSVNGVLSKFAFFIDETVSSFYYLLLFTIGISLLSFTNSLICYVPIKPILLVMVWGFVILLHPNFKDYLFNFVYSEDTRYYFLNKTNKLDNFIYANFEYQEPQEKRQVEIFELQQFNAESKEWEALFYLDDDYSTMSKARLSKKQLVGTTNLNNVKPPKHWCFVKNDKWKIDLYPETWVNDHLVGDFVTIDDKTKWVYDKPEGAREIQVLVKPSDEDDEDEEGANEKIYRIRRRRWTTAVVRASECNDDDNDEYEGTDISNDNIATSVASI